MDSLKQCHTWSIQARSNTWKGLQNRAGENNCFLNSIIQVLWHLNAFRKSFNLITGHACTEKSCIFCALKVVFTQFQFSDHATLLPDSLRQALATAFRNSRRFQIGFMDDATECLETILKWLHFHLVCNEPFDTCSAPHCIPHAKFGMTLTEQALCVRCGVKTKQLTFTELAHYVPTSSILQAFALHRNGSSPVFGKILKLALDTDTHSCPAGCGGKMQLGHKLINAPDVVTVGLVWDSDNASVIEVSQLTDVIDCSIRQSDIFQSSSSVEFNLVGVVCYYCKHYSTFLFDREKGIWVLCDDATVVTIGTGWSDVAKKINGGHFQPLLLFYENPNSCPVSMVTAPSVTTYGPIPEDFASHSQSQMRDVEGDFKHRTGEHAGGNRFENTTAVNGSIGGSCGGAPQESRSVSIPVYHYSSDSTEHHIVNHTMNGNSECVYRQNRVYHDHHTHHLLSKSSEMLSSDFWSNGFKGTVPKHHPNKRYSYACPRESAYESDKLSFHDDQFFRNSSFQSMNFPMTWPQSLQTFTLPFGYTRSKFTDPVNDVTDNDQGSYIRSETVRSVLAARGLKVCSRQTVRHPKIVEDLETVEMNSSQTNHDDTNRLSSLSGKSFARDKVITGCDRLESFINQQKVLDNTDLDDQVDDTFEAEILTPDSKSVKLRKGILANRRRKKKKRVSFSDEIALVLPAEDQHSHSTNYMDQVLRMSTQNPNHRFSSLSSSGSDSAYSSLSDSTSPSTDSLVLDLTEKTDLLLIGEHCESDSEDESTQETTDSPSNSNQIRCTLCCRKWVLMPGIYCHDCNAYMSRLQPRKQ